MGVGYIFGVFIHPGLFVMVFRFSRAPLLALVLLVLGGLPRLVGAGEVARFDHSSVRLLDGGVIGAERFAGVEILLGEGWKTYWRVPGEAGQPPLFDFSASRNLKSASVLWPAPKRYADPEAGEAIGYKGRVVFPVRVAAVDPGRPVELRLRLDYALCNEICIPARAEVALTLPAGATGSGGGNGLVREFLSRVPGPAGDELRISSAVMRAGDAKHPFKLVVKLRGKALAGLDEAARVDMFVEGPPLAHFCHPRLIEAADGKASYYLPVDGIEKLDELKGEKLKITVTLGERSIEQEVTVP